MDIKKGDKVQIIAGIDKGKTGKVIKVISVSPARHRLLVEGIQLVKKHQRPKKQGEKGEIISFPRSLDISNALLICSNCGKASRIGRKLEGDKKVRYCRKCKMTLQ